jgi:hypothetical protein
MSWGTFKSTLLPAMQSHTFGNSLETFAATFASAYDLSIKTGRTTITSIPCLQGNKGAMQSQLVSLLSTTQKTNAPDFLTIVGPAVIAYWTGATILPIPPAIPCPGAIQNISVTGAPVLSPGVWTPLSVPANNNPQIFINAFCATATIHLTTVSGLHNCICIYPGSPPPVAPGVLPWTGYTAG